MLCIFNNDVKYLEFPPTIPSANRFSEEAMTVVTELLGSRSQNHRITESQNGRGWKGPL